MAEETELETVEAASDSEELNGAASQPEPDHDELEVAFGDEPAPGAPGADSELAKHLRAEIRRRDAELASLRRPTPKVEVGPKPTMESCDFDSEKFETALDAWKGQKAKADAEQSQAQRDAEQAQAAWQQELADFGTKKAALGAKDFEASEEEVVAHLNQMQQAVLVKAAGDSAKLIYALGKSPEKLKALAEITDPIKLAVAVAKLEGTLRVSRRQAPEPEGIVRGSAPLSRGGDKTLERLEAEASKTGDRSKVIAYKREQKAKGQ